MLDWMQEIINSELERIDELREIDLSIDPAIGKDRCIMAITSGIDPVQIEVLIKDPCEFLVKANICDDCRKKLLEHGSEANKIIPVHKKCIEELK